MIIVRCLFLMLFATCFYGSDTLATDFAAPLASHNFFTPELKPSPDSFKLAKSTWLPDSYDDLGLSGHDNTKYDFNKNDCSQYTLSSCPQNGKCTKCPVGTGWKLDSCDTGYTKMGDTCTKKAEFCVENATTFKNRIPNDYYCDNLEIDPKCSGSNCDKCFTSCRKINCDNYPLDCNSINKTVLHIAETAICTDCRVSTSNCIKNYCKIIRCIDGYKIAENGSSCIALDDTCPNGYYKSCETGTQGTPEYTEKGTACYQCKANTIECPKGYELIDGICKQICAAPHCITCVEDTSDKCAICEDGYKLINGVCSKIDSYKCCNTGQFTGGKYHASEDSFEQCFWSTYAPQQSCASSGFQTFHIKDEYCNNFSVDGLHLLATSDFIYDVLEGNFSSTKCQKKDINLQGGNNTLSLFPPLNSDGNAYQTIYVKSFKAPHNINLTNITLMAKDYIVLENTFLSNSIVEAPKIYINGTIGMAKSKIIADNIYIGANNISIETTNFLCALKTGNNCTCDSQPMDETAGTSFIGEVDRPAAFHFNGTSPDQINYGAIRLSDGTHGSNLTIYGYNTEEFPLFSEAVINSENAPQTARNRDITLTISDLTGQSKSNLFYRFQGADTEHNTSSSFNKINAKLIYEGRKSKIDNLINWIKERAYLPDTQCQIQTTGAKNLISFQMPDYQSNTCKRFGLEDNESPLTAIYEACTIANDIPKTKNTNQTEDPALICYENCKISLCEDDQEEFPDITKCHPKLSDRLNEEVYCTEASAQDSINQVCKKMTDAWKKENPEETADDLFIPYKTLNMTNGNKCFICNINVN